MTHHGWLERRERTVGLKHLQLREFTPPSQRATKKCRICGQKRLDIEFIPGFHLAAIMRLWRYDGREEAERIISGGANAGVCYTCKPALKYARKSAERRLLMKAKKAWLIRLGVEYRDEFGDTPTGRRRYTLACATPWWVAPENIRAVYAECKATSQATGIQHHVDHIVPLQGRNVCGLHVPWNLRIIPSAENLSKGNKLLDEAA